MWGEGIWGLSLPLSFPMVNFCCRHHRHLPGCPTAPSPDPTRRCDQLCWGNTRRCWLVSSPLPGKAAQPRAVATASPKELCLWCIFFPASVLTFLQTFKWPSGKMWRLGSSAPSPTVPRSQDPPFHYFPGVFLFSISACRAAWDFKKKCLPPKILCSNKELDLTQIGMFWEPF